MAEPTWQERFRAMTDDWDGRGSRSPTEAAIRGLEGLHFSPLSNGGIQVDLHTGGLDLEFEVRPDGTSSSVCFELAEGFEAVRRTADERRAEEGLRTIASMPTEETNPDGGQLMPEREVPAEPEDAFVIPTGFLAALDDEQRDGLVKRLLLADSDGRRVPMPYYHACALINALCDGNLP